MEERKYGAFAADRAEYVISERKTPRHWYNYFYNERYNAFSSQVGYGEGLLDDELGRRVLLVSDRCVYLTDRKAKTFQTAVGLPMREAFDFYECRHGLGYTTITCEKNGLRSEFTIFVPAEGLFEQWIVRVTNRRDTAADCGLIAYAATESDSPYRPQGYNSEQAHALLEQNLIYSTCLSSALTGHNTLLHPYMATDGAPAAFDTRRTAFLGTYGTKEEPEALLEKGGCTNSETFVEKICYALERDCALRPGESKTFCFQIGVAVTREELSQIGATLRPGEPERLLREVCARRREEISRVSIQTPDENLNRAFPFYQYATAMSSRWARVRHNGFRDRTADTECLSSFNPELARKNFLLALTYQYASGYAPRTVIDGSVRPNNFSDNAVWIPMAAYFLIAETGDLSLLDEEVCFNDGSCASVFEHLRLALDYLYNFRQPGNLIKIWGGDWNDGMNMAGLQGKGVSAWLSIAWCRACKLFCELADAYGKPMISSLFREREAEMERLIEKIAWDRDHYITAINDWDEKIGAWESRYGKFYLNPQIWAVFAGLGNEERRQRLFRRVDEVLETPLGTLVNAPAYKEPDPHVGGMTFRAPGTLINGNVYLHPMAWKIAAEAMLKRPEKLEETLRKILPWDHTYAPTCGEPYILYNMYHGPEAGYRYGTPGQSWRTATTPVLVKNLILFVFGLRPELEGLRVEPVLPPSWKECSLTKTFRGCTYELHYHQAATHTCTVKKIQIDGKTWTGKHLPLYPGKRVRVDVFVK